jgi:hypothetical protein
VGSAVTLESRSQLIQMVVPPSDPILDRTQPRTGSWFELRDGAEKVLYVRLVHDLLGRRQEAPAADQQHLVGGRSRAKSSFQVLVPDLPRAKTVVLFASEGTEPAHEIARCPVEP